MKKKLSYFAAVILARNLLRKVFQNDDELIAKMNRTNFQSRAASVAGVLSDAAYDGIADVVDGTGDWKEVASRLHAHGWYRGVQADLLAVMIRDSLMEIQKAGYSEAEIYGYPTKPGYINSDPDDIDKSPDDDDDDDDDQDDD